MLDDDDAKRAIADLTAVHRALASWGEATGYAPMIDLGPDSAIDVIDYVERALRQFAEKKWTYPIKDWPAPLHQFAIYFPDQIPLDL